MLADEIIKIAPTVIGTLALIIFQRTSKDIEKLTSSVKELNENVAKVITQVNIHEWRLRRLEGNNKNGSDSSLG